MSITTGSGRNKYQAQFQPLMNECRDMVIVYTNALLAELFTNTDSALLDFAKKAETNEIQNRFFEAINEIQSKRPAIERQFRNNVSKNFNAFWGNSSSGDGNSAFGASTLELVDKVKMNESIATENMIARAESNNTAQLYALGQRFAVINSGKVLEQHKLPSSPCHLVASFQDALMPLNISSQIRLIILALFNRCILRQIDSLYEDINNTLKNAGILPHLKPTFQKPPRSEEKKESETAKQSEKGDSSEAIGEELFTSILDLLGAKRKSLDVGKKKRPSGANRAADGTLIQPAKKRELVSAINKLQPTLTTGPLLNTTEDRQSIPNIEVDEQFLQHVKETLSKEQSNLYDTIGRDRLNTLDEDTINLVGLLFEYMLNDPVLPNVAKALLSYLHTPYLKATIIDRSMLKNTQHVARQLLDCLVEAGSHWVDESNLKRGIYPEMQIVTKRILKEFGDDHSLFDELLTNFKKEMQRFKQKTDILEKRAQEAVMGREKLNIAKQRAKQEIKARLHGTKLPPPVKEFLLQSWTDKLIFTLLRHPEGELSPDWKESLRLADDLVWVFEPKATASEKIELTKVLPRIRKTIEEGLASLGGYNIKHSQALFDLLLNSETVLAAATTEFDEVADEQRAQKTQSVGKKVLAETRISTKEESEVSETERAMIDKIREIKFGTWFEISTDDTPKTTQRVRLSWLSPLTSTCMFVDRAGIQTAIKPLGQLAREMIDGRSKVLEDSSDPFVERTLHAIKRMLKQSLTAPDQTIDNLHSDNQEPQDKSG